MAKKKMTLSMDKLTDCPCCTSNACYESEFTTQEGLITTWLCLTCGMTSNSSMEEGSELLKESFELTAEIIKDNKQTQYLKDNFSFDRMCNLLKEYLDRYIGEVTVTPKNVPLQLPKLKKIGEQKAQELPKIKLELPKIK